MEKTNHKRQRAEEDSEKDVDAASTDGAGFGAAMSKIMARDLTGKATPVLAKRKTAQAKQADKAALAIKEDAKKRKLRKRARKAHLVVPDPLQADFERQLRKVATKGVVALFNAIAKHQRAIETATEDLTRTGQKAKVVTSQNKTFLDMLKGNKGGTEGSQAVKGAKNVGAPPVLRPGFLQDNYLKQQVKKPQPVGKGKHAVREEEEEEREDDGWMDGDDGGY
jgi:hypothetical protein